MMGYPPVLDAACGPRHFWHNKAARIFCGSMTDLGHERVTVQMRSHIRRAMEAAPWHQYIVLTKRPGEWLAQLPAGCWVGVSVELERYLRQVQGGQVQAGLDKARVARLHGVPWRHGRKRKGTGMNAREVVAVIRKYADIPAEAGLRPKLYDRHGVMLRIYPKQHKVQLRVPRSGLWQPYDLPGYMGEDAVIRFVVYTLATGGCWAFELNKMEWTPERGFFRTVPLTAELVTKKIRAVVARYEGPPGELMAALELLAHQWQARIRAVRKGSTAGELRKVDFGKALSPELKQALAAAVKAYGEGEDGHRDVPGHEREAAGGEVQKCIYCGKDGGHGGAAATIETREGAGEAAPVR